jgi:hypothetical protein
MAVIEINKFLLGTMAGGAADCQFGKSLDREYSLLAGKHIWARNVVFMS